MHNIIATRFRAEQSKKCFEIDAYPGGYLALLAANGYEVNGIDQCEYVETRLPRFYKSQGYKVGKFKQCLIEDYTDNLKYDLVYSIGFIEHFTNYSDIIIKHTELVTTDGLLFITTPNFKKLQYLLHWLIDRVNLKRHVIQSMNPYEWAQILESKGFDIIEVGYLGGFDFWVEHQPRNILQKIIKKAIFLILPYLKQLVKHNSSFYSPSCYVLARNI